MKHIFISYQHDDGDFAENVAYKMKDEGFSTWVDDRIHTGEDWRAEIDQAIKDSFALIVVMTPTAKASEYVTYEWAFALGVGVKVIPVMQKRTPLHPRLEALQYLDFTSRVRPWDRLIDVVKDIANTYDLSTIHVLQTAPAFIKQAIAKLDSANSEERLAAIDGLVQADHPAAREALIEALQHPMPDVHIFAALGLVHFKDMHAIPRLLDALTNNEDEIIDRSILAEALGQIGDATAVPGLLSVLSTEESEDVRKSIIVALGQIEDATAVPGLLDALRDVSWEVRKSAAGSLGQIGDATAVPGLLDALSKSRRDMRQSVVEAMVKIGKPSVTGLLDALHSANWEIRRSAAEALGKIGDTTAISALLDILRTDEDRNVRQSSAEALGQMEDTTTISGLLDALHDDYWEIRRSAAEALGKIGDATVVSALLDTLGNANELIFVRKSIIVALGQIGDVAAIPRLLDVLQTDKDKNVYRAATNALRQIGTPEALAAIEALQ